VIDDFVRVLWITQEVVEEFLKKVFELVECLTINKPFDCGAVQDHGGLV